MNYLIDTHVLLWSLFDTSKLSKKVYSILSDIENEIFVSSITFWEISLKYSIGKLSLENILPDELPGYTVKAGYKILNPDEKITSSFYKLANYEHGDPFDKLLIWQEICEDYVMISKDSKFKQYEKHGLRIVW